MDAFVWKSQNSSRPRRWLPIAASCFAMGGFIGHYHGHHKVPSVPPKIQVNTGEVPAANSSTTPLPMIRTEAPPLPAKSENLRLTKTPGVVHARTALPSARLSRDAPPGKRALARGAPPGFLVRRGSRSIADYSALRRSFLISASNLQ